MQTVLKDSCHLNLHWSLYIGKTFWNEKSENQRNWKCHLSMCVNNKDFYECCKCSCRKDPCRVKSLLAKQSHCCIHSKVTTLYIAWCHFPGLLLYAKLTLL